MLTKIWQMKYEGGCIVFERMIECYHTVQLGTFFEGSRKIQRNSKIIRPKNDYSCFIANLIQIEFKICKMKAVKFMAGIDQKRYGALQLVQALCKYCKNDQRSTNEDYKAAN